VKSGGTMLMWYLKKDRKDSDKKRRKSLGDICRENSCEPVSAEMDVSVPGCRDPDDVDDVGVDGCARRSFLSDFRCMRNAPEAKHYLHLMRTLAAP